MKTKQKPATQAKKGAKLKASTAKPAPSPELSAANAVHIAEVGLRSDVIAQRQHDRQPTYAARTPPGLLTKVEVCSLTRMTYPTIWKLMREGRFPRSRVAGGGDNSKSVWLASEVATWLTQLPRRRLKGDAPEAALKATKAAALSTRDATNAVSRAAGGCA